MTVFTCHSEAIAGLIYFYNDVRNFLLNIYSIENAKIIVQIFSATHDLLTCAY